MTRPRFVTCVILYLLTLFVGTIVVEDYVVAQKEAATEQLAFQIAKYRLDHAQREGLAP